MVGIPVLDIYPESTMPSAEITSYKPTSQDSYAPWNPDTFRLAGYPGLRSPSFCFGRRLGLPSTHFLCIIEYALSYRGPSWRVLRAKTSEMGSWTPRPTYLRSAFLALLRRTRYQNEPRSPRELYLRISRPRVI